MNSSLKNKKTLLVSILFLILFSSSCTKELKPPQGNNGTNAPLYSNSNIIKIEKTDQKAFINEYLGIPIRFPYSCNISWTEDAATRISRDLENAYEENKWRDTEDWIKINDLYRLSWTYGDLLSFVFLIENMNNESLDLLERKFGIFDIPEGSTLIITLLYDTQQEIENDSDSNSQKIELNIFSDYEGEIFNQYSYSDKEIFSSSQIDDQPSGMQSDSNDIFQTATADQSIRYLTQTLETDNRHATETWQAETSASIASTEAFQATEAAAHQSETATSIVATEMCQATESAAHLASTATVEARIKSDINAEAKQLFPTLNTEFDINELPDTWMINRPDPSRWNLTKFPGNLQLFGASKTPSGYLNTFTQNTSLADMSIITKIEPRLKAGTASSDEKRFISIGFSPNDEKDGYGSGVGIYYHYTNGYHAFFWACPKDYCSSPVDSIIDDYKLPKDNTLSYLKLERKDNNYTGYYSSDGSNWIYIGESDDIPVEQKTTQVVLKSGCVKCSDFHSRIDFIRYELIEEE